MRIKAGTARAEQTQRLSGLGAPEHVMDHAGYSRVVIQKSDTVLGAHFKRGSTHFVDTATMKALTDAGLVDAAG